MPIPLIAAALIAAGSASGGAGLRLGGKGAADIKKARSDIKGAERRYLKDHEITERAMERTNLRLEELGRLQEASLRAAVLRMGDFLRRNEKQVRESERLLVEGIEATVGSVSGVAQLDADAVAWVRGIVGSAAVAGGVSTGVTSAVGAYGVASTGAAISGLSGAAAESATLAALGGGSLASGGGGMALGATALNFITIGPALLVGGFVVKGQGTKARTKARKYQAQVKVAIAEGAENRARFAAVDERTEELAQVLSRLQDRAVESLDVLESEPFDAALHADRFQRSLNLVMAVRDVAATPVVDGAGELNDRTAAFAVKYRPMTKGEGGEDG